MFPLNQDTLIVCSGHTANDYYSDGYGYVYMIKEGRGRSSSGNFLLSKTLNNWYIELNTLIEDGSSLFVDNNYHGNALDNRKNVVYARPVVAQQSGAVSVSVESNLVNNAYGNSVVMLLVVRIFDAFSASAMSVICDSTKSNWDKLQSL